MASTVGSTAEDLPKLDINGDWASPAPNLQKNLSLLPREQIELAKMLLELGQSHLFEHWPGPGVDDDEKRAFFDQALDKDCLRCVVARDTLGQVLVAGAGSIPYFCNSSCC